MKLVSFRHNGVESFGRLVEDQIVDGRGAVPGCDSILDLLSGGKLGEFERATQSIAPTCARGEVTLLPVIPHPEKIICVGLNYKTHQDEADHQQGAKPTLFTRFADSQIGADAQIEIPDIVECFDYEGELALVIGKHAANVAGEDAYDYIAGYACYNDFSARDWQGHGAQWTPGKNFLGTGAFGPAMVTADEIENIESLQLETRVNGETRQSARVADLIFSIPELIEYISTFTVLNPGDVIVTGTPGGVGLFRDPPEFLRDGDTVEVEITGLGVLRTSLVAQRASAAIAG